MGGREGVLEAGYFAVAAELLSHVCADRGKRLSHSSAESSKPLSISAPLAPSR